MDTEKKNTRLNKYIALSGLCSRNQAAAWIKAGLVKVNDKIVKEPFIEIGDDDVVTVKNKRVSPKVVYTYYVMNKPWHAPVHLDIDAKSLDIYTLLKKQTEQKLEVIGNPDAETCGLIVFTDDKSLLEKLNVIGHQLKTVFEATLDKPWEATIADNDTINDSFKIKGIKILDELDKNVVGLEVIGGIYPDVKFFFKDKGYTLKKLDCTFFGGITKKDLKRGWSRALTEKETIFIKHFT